eukprot:746377-Hanusia_phi.AAC.1
MKWQLTVHWDVISVRYSRRYSVEELVGLCAVGDRRGPRVSVSSSHSEQDEGGRQLWQKQRAAESLQVSNT